MRYSFVLSLLPLALALPTPDDLGSILGLPGVSGSTLGTAPLIVPQSAIPGKYIVKVTQPNQLALIVKALGRTPTFVYNYGDFYGFAADMPDNLVKSIRLLPGVEYVEQDAIARASVIENHLEKRTMITQNPATWGEARISHLKNTSTTYTYDSTQGSGSCAYVVDTGIYTQHPEFEGRATFLANFAGDGSNTDGNGHGTHCAGTVGSKTYGIAKKVNLYAVKVLGADGSGTNSAVIAGINYAVNDQKNGRAASCPKGAVISMSLGGGQSSAVNSAAASAVKAGLFMAVAAGNSAQDASNASPASEPTVFTVAAVDKTDRFATSFSNFGSPVKILAPGVDVLSTWLKNGTNVLSGTSMATPHIAGLAAYILALEGARTPAALGSRLQSLALKNVITAVPANTVNYLAFNGNPNSR